MEVVAFLMGVIIGLLFGLLAHHLLSKRRKVSGAILVDLIDPTNEFCSLELYENLDTICKQTQVVFDVRVYGDNSH